MIELGRYARDGRLQYLLSQPWLQAWNGVEGVALSYDDRLVAEAGRASTDMMPAGWRGSVEHSRHVAALLAAVAERWEGSSGREPDYVRYPGFLAERLADWWHWSAKRSGHGDRSPIVVGVAAGPAFGRETRPKPGTLAESPFSVRIRQSRGATLHAAAAGGWIAERGPVDRGRSGTSGGFLVDDFTGDTWVLTAAHVCGDRAADARALPMPRAHPALRSGAGTLFGLLGMGRFRVESCEPFWSSWPDVVAAPHCTVSATPDTRGLDVALNRVSRRSDISPVATVDLADVSQVLDLTFRGSTSGLRQCAPSAYSLWHSYEFEGTQRCVHDCIQIRLKDRPYVRTNVSSGGDSGSWLLARGAHGMHWAGLLTGGDGDRAGVVPATRILDALATELSLSVTAYV